MTTYLFRYVEIAHVCHEANRALQIVLGEEPSPPWEELDDETQASAVNGVDGVFSGNTPEQSHESWMKFKLEHGWTYGPVKDQKAKTHPCLVPYKQLPMTQRLKDSLFVSTVLAFEQPLKESL